MGQKFNSGIGNILKPLDLVLKALKNQVKQPQRNKKNYIVLRLLRIRNSILT